MGVGWLGHVGWPVVCLVEPAGLLHSASKYGNSLKKAKRDVNNEALRRAARIASAKKEHSTLIFSGRLIKSSPTRESKTNT